MSVYEGKDKYIFVSYAHKDSAAVVPMINALQQAGFRVWYDEGIQAGTEWPAYIEEHLNNCSCVLVCMSPSAVNSINCRNEINLACMLGKDMLVVYLEETTLAKGMNLQLNSQQSIFRNRHTDDKTFLAQLIKAGVLQSCKISDKNTGNPDLSFLSDIRIPHNEDSRKNIYTGTTDGSTNAVAISRVGTMGSNTPNDPWPKGTYEQRIEITKYKTVLFHCNLIHPCQRAENKAIHLQIFDAYRNLVFEKTFHIQLSPGNDKISLPWEIKDDIGLSQAPGQYTATFTVENSRSYEHVFELTLTRKTEADEKELEKLQKKLRYPKLYFLYLISSIFGIAAISGVGDGDLGLFFIGGIVWLILSIFVCRKTKEVVVKNGFLAFLLTFIVSFYYGIYLFVMMIVTYANRRKWKERIRELEAKG